MTCIVRSHDIWALSCGDQRLGIPSVPPTRGRHVPAGRRSPTPRRTENRRGDAGSSGAGPEVVEGQAGSRNRPACQRHVRSRGVGDKQKLRTQTYATVRRLALMLSRRRA
jgi:hypothetical protein